VEYDHDALTVRVADDGIGPISGPDAGQGVTGMRERATSLGGWLTAGKGEDGGFAVHAWLPMPGHGSSPVPTPTEAAPTEAAPTEAATTPAKDVSVEHLAGGLLANRQPASGGPT